MRTKWLFQEELRNNPQMSETEAVLRFAWCALRGFNVFDVSFDEFSMYIDNEGNENIIEGITDIMTVEGDDKNEESEEEKK